MAERSHWWIERWLMSPLFLSLSVSFSDYIYLPTHVSIYVSIYLSLSLSVCLSVYVSIYLSTNPSVCLSIYLPVYLQAWKRSYSARPPQCLNLITSKTKQFCETSSCFKVDNINKQSDSARLLHFSKLTTSKTNQFCETSFKSGKLRAALTASYQCVLRFFQSICLNYCACHEKVACQVIRSAAPVTQNHLSKPEDLIPPKCNPSQEISARTS